MTVKHALQVINPLISGNQFHGEVDSAK